MAKGYNRVMLGKAGMYADQCRKEGFIGVDFLPDIDLFMRLPDVWQEFNKTHIPIWMESHPGKSKIAAGLACGNLWTVCKGLQIDDIVLSPNGCGQYYAGRVTSNYFYKKGEILPHRRKVEWFDVEIEKNAITENLRHSMGSIGTCCDITQYAQEIDNLINRKDAPYMLVNPPDFEDVSEFALEKHLEEFLVKNWRKTDLGKKYDIFEENGELVGQQYQTDTGAIDILAVSKDKKTILVIELKRGRTSDVVVGQIQRYMGYVKEELSEPTQKVRGMIIGLDADIRLKRALSVCSDIEFYRYQIDFKLIKDGNTF